MTPVDEIKNRLDIVEVIGGYIKLKKAGKDYKAHCPFHKEKNPSFFVSPSKQIWHCFSCQNGGDIFSFVEKIEGIEFVDALRILAQKAGVPLKREDPKLRSQRTVLYEICSEAAEFFQKELEKDKAVQDYLKNRGLSPNTIKEFKIGYAPDSWDALFNHFTELGHKPDDIEKAGFIVKKENERRTSNVGQRNYYDRFRGRIMFPLADLNGQIVGFSGRIFGKEDEKKAKYVNSPDTLIYNKSQIIFGMDKAKAEIRKKNECITVEGQFDLIMAHQAGTKNTVATSGTALTANHLQIIKRYTENLVFSFDADTGGEGATKKAIGLAQQFDFNIKVVVLPKEEKDPAELIKKSPQMWQKALENTKPIMDFYFDNTFSKYPQALSVENKREIAKELLYPIKNINNTVEQAHWVQLLASKLKMEERGIIEALRKIKAREEGQADITPEPEIYKKSRIKDLEEYLLGLILKYTHYLKHVNEELDTVQLSIAEFKNILGKIKTEKEFSADENQIINYLTFKIEHCNLEEEKVLDEIKCCIKELRMNNLKEKLREIALDVREAEEKKEKEKAKNLTQKFLKLSQQLNEINN